jgi:hypothetical protein
MANGNVDAGGTELTNCMEKSDCINEEQTLQADFKVHRLLSIPIYFMTRNPLRASKRKIHG